MKCARFVQLTVALVLLAAVPSVYGWNPAEPERLSYTVRWLGLTAGGAEVYYAPCAPQQNSITAPSTSYTMVVRAWTGPAVRWAYHVRDRITVHGVHTVALPFGTKKYHLEQRENDYSGNKELLYKRSKNELVFRNILAREAPRVDPMPSTEVRDILSNLYLLRMELADIHAGKQWTYTMYDLTRPHALTITAVAQSTVDTPMGTFDAWELSLRQEEIGGDKVVDDTRIWVSTDPRRLPLKFSVGLPFGSFTARLEDIGTAPADPENPARSKLLTPPADLPVSGTIPKHEPKEVEEDFANPHSW